MLLNKSCDYKNSLYSIKAIYPMNRHQNIPKFVSYCMFCWGVFFAFLCFYFLLSTSHTFPYFKVMLPLYELFEQGPYQQFALSNMVVYLFSVALCYFYFSLKSRLVSLVFLGLMPSVTFLCLYRSYLFEPTLAFGDCTTFLVCFIFVNLLSLLGFFVGFFFFKTKRF